MRNIASPPLSRRSFLVATGGAALMASTAAQSACAHTEPNPDPIKRADPISPTERADGRQEAPLVVWFVRNP